MKGRVLIVAGSDSGGGAGIQADIKTVTALNGYAATALTALTAQDTLGVHGIHEVPVDFLRQQMTLVLDDIGADAVKTGMLHRTEVLEAVAAVLDEKAAGMPLVVDPVMVAKGGASLLDEDARQVLRRRLIAQATVITPNLPEAEILAGRSIASPDEMLAAGREILALGPQAVLMKGGHLDGDEVTDILVTAHGAQRFTSPRLHTTSTHGTGCTLASAIATGLAQGLALDVAVAQARVYVLEAIRTAPGYGRGHGPLNHAHTVRQG
ncbi:MAG TPA: bifunctional hydroxymethylpyrimidine kinase/phosphomethylpyrimidine kinase [Alphaproteobacteria bacterium]|jgi:hydroxymethylpyrimidine/phosphomethylpyrimidine kinase|nr:bifunctional hydroxymethylpyrimidine kinase/phosphomethylpyrimidine kinase [Alphaproteobacteria bacterium]